MDTQKIADVVLELRRFADAVERIESMGGRIAEAHKVFKHIADVLDAISKS